MKTRAVSKNLNNERGLATVEAIPLLIMFIMLSGYAIGMFGAIHTAVLQSIAARTYAFETFRNRTNLNIFREARTSELLSYAKKGMRYHTITNESVSSTDGNFYPAARPLSVGYPPPDDKGQPNDHNNRIFDLKPRNQSVEVAPIWIMVGYGMCLNAGCGD